MKSQYPNNADIYLDDAYRIVDDEIEDHPLNHKIIAGIKEELKDLCGSM